MGLKVRQWCAVGGALWFLAANIHAADTTPQRRQLTLVLHHLWQEASALASVDDEQKKGAWALDVHSRIVDPYLGWWRFSGLLDRLLAGAEAKPNEIQRQALERVLADTMSRYVFEVLLDHAIDGHALEAIEVVDVEDRSQIALTISGPFGLPVQVVYFTEGLTDQWHVVDMVVAGVRYSEWKGHRYRKSADNGDWSTLLTELEAKNQEFFGQFCDQLSNRTVELGEPRPHQMMQTPLPRYLSSACPPVSLEGAR